MHFEPGVVVDEHPDTPINLACPFDGQCGTPAKMDRRRRRRVFAKTDKEECARGETSLLNLGRS